MRLIGLILILACLGSPAFAQETTGTNKPVRFVQIFNGKKFGEWRVTKTGPNTWRYETNLAQTFDRTEELVLDASGLPKSIRTEGEIQEGVPWFEFFAQNGLEASWRTPRDRGTARITAPSFYKSVYPAHDLGVLARALLRQPNRCLELLPNGKASLREIEELRLSADGETRRVRLVEIRGVNLMPDYVWLGEDNQTFADEWSVVEGWEPVFPELLAAIARAVATERARLVATLKDHDPTDTLLLRNVRVFDSQTGNVAENQSILIEGTRIVAVGPAASVTPPTDHKLIEGDGRTALPGLWDVHGHTASLVGGNQIARRGSELLHVAAGVTSVRDVGSDVPSIVALADQIENGRAIGPRLIKAGFLFGPAHNENIGFAISNEKEARAAVERYAELGFELIKFYPADLETTHAAIAKAKELGLGVTGHLSDDMTTSDAVEAGYDQLMHIWWIALLADKTNNHLIESGETFDSWYQLMAALTSDSAEVKRLVEFLAERQTPIDTTIGYLFDDGSPKATVALQFDHLPSVLQRRLMHGVSESAYHPVSPLAQASYYQSRQNMLDILLLLHERKVPLMPGTDTWPGFGLHFELERYVDAGIPAKETLSYATLGSATVLGKSDQLGSIEVGKLADIILVDGRPEQEISDIRRVDLVLKDGMIFDPTAIYGELGTSACRSD